MGLDASFDYDVPAAAVYAMFTSEDYLRAKATQLGHSNLQVKEVRADDSGSRVEVKRGLPMPLPGFVKKFVPGGEPQVNQIEEWGPDEGDGARRGTWSAVVDGIKSETIGSQTIEPTGASSCRHAVTGTVKVSIPLVGGKLADFASGSAKDLLATEHEFNVRWLAEHA